MRLGIVLIGINWAAYSVFIIPNVSNLIELALSVTILTALSGGSTSTLSGDKFVCAVFVSLLMLPLTAVLLISEIESVYYLGILSGGFYLVILGSGLRGAQFTYESAKTKYEKDSLVYSLEKRVKQRTSEIEKLSNIDSLTKLLNRKAFSQQLTELMSLSASLNKKLAVSFIDLDGFKSINDIHGHKVGDQILKIVASRLAEFYFDKGILCRWGGDEFIVISEFESEREILNESNQLISHLASPIKCEVGVVGINATIGISLFPVHGTTESELISHADIAMYQQKSKVKGKVLVFSEDMRDALANQLIVKNNLSHAIENNEFYLVYQPIVNPQSAEVFFAEALIRWEKDGKLISPITFIPIAEQYGLIQEIGTWVARKVADDLSAMKEKVTFVVSINVSVAELMLVDFAERFYQIFASKSVDAKQICIEVTESVLTHDVDFMLDSLSKLRAFGFIIAVDDFGTGYSSLSQIQKLSPSIIKIDKSFVDNWQSGGKSIIKAVNDISAELSFTTVVEGIEKQEQLDKVLQIGVTQLQGFYFAKPMLFDDLIDWKLKAN